MDWLHEEQDSAIEDIDFPQNFSETFSNEICVETRNTMKKIANIWIEMGLSSARLERRIEEIRALFHTVLNNSHKTESKSLEELIKYKETKLNEINAILNDLTLSPFIPPTDLSLMQVSKLLYHKCNELLEVKNERMSQLTELKSKRDNLCVALNMKLKPMKTLTNIPSEQELMDLQSYVSDLTKEKTKRFNKFVSIKKIIEKLFIDLEREVNNDFENKVIYQDSKDFILSEENIKMLNNLHSELESIYALNNDKRKQLEKRLNSLWNKLEVSQSYRDSFFRDKNGCKPSVLALLELEVEKYEELKRQNIELFVEKVRNELNDWIDKCFVSDDIKSQLSSIMNSNEFDEHLLDAHEEELRKLQEYYDKCERIFLKLEERNDLWDRFIELENKSNDPNRFNNRGGALLQEEKDKKILKRKLPLIQREIKNLSDECLKKNGIEFNIYGIKVENFFEEQRNIYYESKENEKKERQRIKQIEIQGQLKGKKMTPIGGGIVLRKTPVKRVFTPLSPGPSGSSNSKIRRMGCAPLTPSRINNNVIQDKNPRVRANLESQMDAVANTPDIIEMTVDEEDFQAPLGERDNANSTFISVTQRSGHSKNVTKRRERQQIKPLNRRVSRSCSDLAQAVNSCKINCRPIPATRSTPVSPRTKSNYISNCTPNRFPRIAVGQRKRPFLV